MIPLVKAMFKDSSKILSSIKGVIDSGIVAEGEQVYSFEAAFKLKFGIDNGISTSSGTAALDIIYLHAGIGQGDEVISTPMTAEPTNTAIAKTGAKVVFADVDRENGLLTLESIKNEITARTKAVCLVHYAGYVCDLGLISTYLKQKNILLIEDCAHALGAKYGGSSVGSYGDYGIFSFQAIKQMTTIDGGFLVFKNKEWESNLKKIRWFGLEKGKAREDNRISVIGSKYNFNNVNAAIGLYQLTVVDEYLGAYKKNSEFLNNQLKYVAGVKPGRVVSNSSPSYWLYTLLANDSKNLINHLNQSGIGASKLHVPNTIHPIFEATEKKLDGMNEFYSNLVHLPVGPWVTMLDLEYTVDRIKEFYLQS